MKDTYDNTILVKAETKDTMCLRELARTSEAHWGYDIHFLKVFDQIFNITDEFIKNNPVYVLWINEKPEAFWGLVKAEDGWELEYFYVSESDLGKGYGKQMWKHMISWCRAQVSKEPEEQNPMTAKQKSKRKVTVNQVIHFVTSPQAVGFYERMGAVQDKMVESVIDGRQIPHLFYHL